MKNKIKKIEKLLHNWEFVNIKKMPFTNGVIFGLRTALEIMNDTYKDRIDCKMVYVCTEFKEGNCEGYPCPGYVPTKRS